MFGPPGAQINAATAAADKPENIVAKFSKLFQADFQALAAASGDLRTKGPGHVNLRAGSYPTPQCWEALTIGFDTLGCELPIAGVTCLARIY